MAEDAVEVTESLSKEAGLVGLDGPLDQLELTKMLAESFEPQEHEKVRGAIAKWRCGGGSRDSN